MKRCLIVLILCFALVESNAQAPDTTSLPSVGGSVLFIAGLNPGLSGSIEKALLQNRLYALTATAKTGFYVHRYNHTGIFVMLQSGVRYRLTHGLFIDNYVGVGYLHTFLAGGKSYYVDVTGTVKQAHNVGSGHFMPSISPGLSYELKHARIFARTMIFWQIPFNTVALVQYGLEGGVSFPLKR